MDCSDTTPVLPLSRTFAPADALLGMKSPALGALLGADVGRQVGEAWVSIRSLPGQKAESVLLLMGPGVESIATRLRAKGVTVCFLDQRTLLSGEWSAVNRALTLVVAGAPGPMSKRAAELWANNDLWLIAGRQMINQLLPPNSDPSGLAGASLGVSLQDKGGLNILFTGATSTETARWASKLSQNPGEAGPGRREHRKERQRNQRACGLRSRATAGRTEAPDCGSASPRAGHPRDATSGQCLHRTPGSGRRTKNDSRAETLVVCVRNPDRFPRSFSGTCEQTVGPPILAAAALSRRLFDTSNSAGRMPACRQTWRPHYSANLMIQSV
jgi:hypothetical protein